MGRPLNDKFFGNRNIGSASTTADNGIGGTAVASVTLGTLGSYTVRPTITFSAPDLAAEGGVTALGTVTSEVLSAAVSGTQTRAYPVAAGAIGFNTGGSTFTATVTSAALTTVARASATTISFDAANAAIGVSGNSIHITGASITGTMTIGGVAIAAGQIYYNGTPSTTTSATLYATYADAVAGTNPLTIVAGTGTGGATFTYGVTYGVVTALTPVNRGSYEALVASGPAVNATYGAGLTITPTYRAKSIIITEQGSGYSHAVDATASFSGSATLPGTPTVVMLTDTGIVGTAGNQENAITMTAYLTGGSSVLVDIKKQVSTNRYKVTDGTRTGIVKLQAASVSAAGQATVVATDATGCTYYVTKLTAHKATLTRFGGGSYEFATGAAVPWTMNGTSGVKAYSTQPYLATGVNVQIANT
jgi:hypothetical protein